MSASASFTPAVSAGTSFGFSSTLVALPGVGTVLRVANLGPCHITVLLGIAGTVVNQSTGLVVMAGQVEYLTVGSATHIAGVSAGGPGNTSTVNLSSGELVLPT